MKMTLLEMVQNILSAMDEMEINSIGDTVVSTQVAEEVRTTYYENLGNFEVEGKKELITFEALIDPTDHPNVLKVPDNVAEFYWVRYNKNTVAEPEYVTVEWCDPDDFMDRVLQYNDQGSKVTVKDITTDLPYKIYNDQYPRYYTTFDDEHIVFDSYDAALDSTLQESKLMAFAQTIPSFSITDTFVPDLHDKFFPMLLAEAKASSWINHKGVGNAKEEQRARRQRVRHIGHKHRYHEKNPRTDFGRK